jgi:hypothetical protein
MRSGLKKRPSDLIERNCWISFEPVEGSLSVLADYIGPHKIMWATDCPHLRRLLPTPPRHAGFSRDRAGASEIRVLPEKCG